MDALRPDCSSDISWSPWLQFADAVERAPRLPGVYRARQAGDYVVYIGMAGERRGHGLSGRLRQYASRAGATGGLAEAVLDRALADAGFVEAMLERVKGAEPLRTADWGSAAFAWADLEVSWTTCSNGDDARTLEAQLIAQADQSKLWNRTIPVTDLAVGEACPSGLQPAPRAAGDQLGALWTQRITDADLKSGSIRIPVDAKHVFPTLHLPIDVVAGDEVLHCKWNPNGRRSGLLRPPRSWLVQHCQPNTRLQIHAHEHSIHLDGFVDDTE